MNNRLLVPFVVVRRVLVAVSLSTVTSTLTKWQKSNMVHVFLSKLWQWVPTRQVLRTHHHYQSYQLFFGCSESFSVRQSVDCHVHTIADTTNEAPSFQTCPYCDNHCVCVCVVNHHEVPVGTTATVSLFIFQEPKCIT